MRSIRRNAAGGTAAADRNPPVPIRSPCYKRAPKDIPVNRTLNKGGHPMRHADRLNFMCGVAVVAAIVLSAAPSRAQTADPNSAPNTVPSRRRLGEAADGARLRLDHRPQCRSRRQEHVDL